MILPFNSRPHKEVDGRLGETLRSRRLSIHDLTRRSTDNHQSAGSVTFFQFTTSQGGRQRSDYCDNRGDPFNSRPHKEVDQPGERKASKTITFQFTTSQGGRPGSPKRIPSTLCLSIHDLTRRSTCWDGRGGEDNDLSIHDSLSIHDLTRRSTSGRKNKEWKVSFQFTTSQGGRLNGTIITERALFFQFTTSQGGRRYQNNLTDSRVSFNSRPHKEVDAVRCHQGRSRNLSIHDLTRRSTANSHNFCAKNHKYFIYISQSINTVLYFTEYFPIIISFIFPISSANLPFFFCALHIRTRGSEFPSHQNSVLSLCVPLYFCICHPNYKIASYLPLYQ